MGFQTMMSKERYFETRNDLKTTVRYISPDGYARGRWGKQQRYELCRNIKRTWKSGYSDKVQNCRWYLAEPVGVRPETAFARWPEDLSEEPKEQLKELLGYYVKISA